MAVPGSVVGVGKLITPGGQQGPKGDAGTAANVPLADITQNGLLRQNTGKTTDFVDGTNNCQPIIPQITSVRLRSFNSLGNPNFEVDQRLCGAANTANGMQIDRWVVGGAGTWTTTKQQVTVAGGPLAVPGTSFGITNKMLRVTLTGQQASLGATDVLQIAHNVEGSQFRELAKDVHSLSLFVASSVSNLKFSVALISPDNTSSIVYLCTLGATGGYTLIQLPNIPVWSGGNFSMTPGVQGYVLKIGLAIGSTYIASSTGSFLNGQFIGAPGMSNFAASPVNSTFDLAFVQHEPGSLCTTLMDKPFSQNLDECLRYYQKSYDYDIAVGTVNAVGYLQAVQQTTTALNGAFRFFKPMAKIPTVVNYNLQTGNPNGIRVAGVDYAVSAINGPGKNGFVGLTTGSAMPAVVAGSMAGFHYAADTGW